MGWVGKVAKVGGMVGTIIPAGLLMVLAVIYLASGGQSQMNFDGNFFPDFSNFDNLVLASSIFLFYAGMEMGGIHVKDMQNPSKNYPKAVFIGALITVIIFVLGTFSLGIIIPAKDISLTQSFTCWLRQLFLDISMHPGYHRSSPLLLHSVCWQVY